MAERTDLIPQKRETDQSLPRSASEIRHDIAAKRESISETVDRLGERIHESLDWHSYVAEHPYIALGVAAGAGFLLSGLFKRRPSPRDRIIDAVAETIEDVTDRVRGNLDDVIRSKNGGFGHTIRAAVTTMASAYAVEFLKRKASEKLSQPSAGGQREIKSPVSRRTGLESTDVEITRSSTAGSPRS